jgi:hypothetical protein
LRSAHFSAFHQKSFCYFPRFHATAAISATSAFPARNTTLCEPVAVTNLSIGDVEADFGDEQADTFRRNLYADLTRQFDVANPPSATA